MTNPMPIWGFVSIGLAILYFFVWPKQKPDDPTPRPARRQFILRWFHSLVWVFLAVAFFMWTDWLPGRQVAGILGFVALGLYLTFIGTFLRDKRGG